MTSEADRWVEVRPDVQGGTPVVRGTRIPLNTVIKYLSAGYSADQICDELPTLTPEAVEAVRGHYEARSEGGRQRVVAA